MLDRAEQTLQLFRGLMAEMPAAAGQMLIALDFYLGPVAEIVVAGDMGNDEMQRALHLLRRDFRPHQVLGWRPADPAAAAQAEKIVPLLAGRTAQEAVTTYICRHFSCEAPVVGADALAARLGAR